MSQDTGATISGQFLGMPAKKSYYSLGIVMLRRVEASSPFSHLLKDLSESISYRKKQSQDREKRDTVSEYLFARASGFERQQGLRAEASQDWGAQTPFLEGTHGLMCPGTWGKTVTLQELWPDLPAGLKEFPGGTGGGRGSSSRAGLWCRHSWNFLPPDAGAKDS